MTHSVQKKSGHFNVLCFSRAAQHRISRRRLQSEVELRRNLATDES